MCDDIHPRASMHTVSQQVCQSRHISGAQTPDARIENQLMEPIPKEMVGSERSVYRYSHSFLAAQKLGIVDLHGRGIHRSPLKMED